jgi:hypothetical protein
MEWFAVTSAVTTSLAWAGADARARGAWVSLADVCRQTMTEGRIRDGHSQLKRVCRLARVGVSDLRAAINAGLVVPDGDDLMLTGWDHGKEREAARAAQRSRDHRQRHQRQESSDATPPVAEEATVEPSSVREPFANGTPYAHPNSGTEKRREEKTREETPSPSPQGVIPMRAHASDAATAATAQVMQPGSVRESFAYATPNDPRVEPGTVRERFANAEVDESQESPANLQNQPLQLAPKRTRHDALPALRKAAIEDNALAIITAMGGCLRGPAGTDYTPEWQRELAGIDAREVLALCQNAADPIRLPSGLRRERETWRHRPLDERRRLVHQVCTVHGIPIEKRPTAPEPPS